MTDLKPCVKWTTIILGFLTILVGIFLLFIYLFYGTFRVAALPIYMMPFFLALLGVMVLSNEYDFPLIKETCQFLNHKVGVVVFYIYLSSLMGYFSGSVKGIPKIGDLAQIITVGCSVGYLVLGVLFGLISCFGEEKVAGKIDSVTQKITKDEETAS